MRVHRTDIDRAARLGHLGAQVLALVLVAVPLALAVRHGCVHPGPPVDRPVAGTARAGYCDAVAGSTPWLGLVALPVAVLVAGSWLTRRRGPLAGWVVAAGLVVALGVNALALLSTEFARTV